MVAAWLPGWAGWLSEVGLEAPRREVPRANSWKDSGEDSGKDSGEDSGGGFRGSISGSKMVPT